MNAATVAPTINFLPWDALGMAKVIGPVLLVLAIMWALDQLLSPISAIEFGIVGFFGKRGSGKSFTMVQYARRWRSAHPHAPVFTNMERLELPGDGPIFLNCTHEQIQEARDALVLIDEAGIFLNSWNFTNTGQRQMARWIAATRHYKVMLLLTAHDPGHVNNRVRDVVDEFYMMTSWKGIRLFHGYVYGNAKQIGQPKKHDKQVFIPMLPTTMHSYNTDSLRKQADAQGVNIIGTDDSMQLTVQVNDTRVTAKERSRIKRDAEADAAANVSDAVDPLKREAAIANAKPHQSS